MQLQQRDDNHKQEEYDGLRLADALPLGSGAGVEGIVNIVRQHHRLLGGFAGGQRQALTLMMATFNPPKLLLLDEHTAALDPATAEKVLALTKSIVSENNLTCLMITHNMQSALELGNRTIMMHGGNIIFDAEGEERSKLTVQDLLGKFKENAGKELDNDRMLLV